MKMEDNTFTFNTEKDIIYFCRSNFGNYKKHTKKTREMYEKTTLRAIKSKEWNWQAKDIDNNTILTYPVYNNCYLIVQYLLENKIYNITKYEEYISQALCSCIMLTGEKMMNQILSYHDLDIRYKSDMAVKALEMGSYIIAYKKDYVDKALTIMSTSISFEHMMVKIMKSVSIEEEQMYCLLEYPLMSFKDKKDIINKMCNIDFFKADEMVIYSIKNKMKIIDKWEFNHNLEYDLIKKDEKNNSKLKL